MELEEYEYNDKPRGEDDFELDDIDDEEDEGFLPCKKFYSSFYF